LNWCRQGEMDGWCDVLCEAFSLTSSGLSLI